MRNGGPDFAIAGLIAFSGEVESAQAANSVCSLPPCGQGNRIWTRSWAGDGIGPRTKQKSNAEQSVRSCSEKSSIRATNTARGAACAAPRDENHLPKSYAFGCGTMRM
jgi:hypothetical protein